MGCLCSLWLFVDPGSFHLVSLPSSEWWSLLHYCRRVADTSMVQSIRKMDANGKQKKAGVAILTSDKIDIKIKKITRDRKGYNIMIKGPIQEEDITIVNIYASNIGSPQSTRHTLTDIKGETDSNTIIVGDFHIPLTPMDKSSKQKINKGKSSE